MNELADHIASGSCDTYPAYQNLVGKVQGLAAAERELLDLVAQLRKVNGLPEETEL